jgi:hypothetical protein
LAHEFQGKPKINYCEVIKYSIFDSEAEYVQFLTTNGFQFVLSFGIQNVDV